MPAGYSKFDLVGRKGVEEYLKCCCLINVVVLLMDRVAGGAAVADYSLFAVEIVVAVVGAELQDELDDRTYFVEAIKPPPFRLDQNCGCTHKLSFLLIQPVNKESKIIIIIHQHKI
jgi:hypothetical protein